MTFTLPTDLPTDWVDESSTIDAADWNNTATLANALKAAVGTFGFNTRTTTVATSESTASLTYTDLTTTTDQVTVAIGSSGKALVMIRADITCHSHLGFMAYGITGSTTRTADDTRAVSWWGPGVATVASSVSTTILEENLTPGFVTFKLKYRSANSGSSQTFANRRITVIPLPSTDGTHESASINLDTSSAVALGMSGAGVNRPLYDSVGAGYKAGGATGSWSHTIGANATALVVALQCNAASGVTVNIDGSTSLLQLGMPAAAVGGGTMYEYIFGIINPPTGTHTINVANASGYLVGNSAAYTNTVAFGCLQTSAGTGTTSTQAALTSVPGRLIFQTFGSLGSGVATGYTQTERWNGWTSGAYPMNFGDAAAATATTNFATTNTTTNGWAGAAVELIASVPTYSKPTWVGTGSGGGHLVGPNFSWVDTIPADCNCAVVWFSTMSDTLTPATVTIGGTTATAVTGNSFIYDGAGTGLQCFYLLNPPTGPGKTIAVAYSGNNWVNATAVYYGGVTAVLNSTSASGAGGTQPSIAIPSSDANHLYSQAFAYCAGAGGDTMTAYSGSRRAAWPTNYYDDPITVGDAAGNGGTLTISATRNNTSYNWGGAAIDLSNTVRPTSTFNLAVTPTITMTPMISRFTLPVTPAVSMTGVQKGWRAEVNLPFMVTVGMTGVGHDGS